MNDIDLKNEARIILKSALRRYCIIYIIIALLIGLFLPNILGKVATVSILCLMLLVAIFFTFRIDFEKLEYDIYLSLLDDYYEYLDSLSELEKLLEDKSVDEFLKLQEAIIEIAENYEVEKLSDEELSKLLKDMGFENFEIKILDDDDPLIKDLLDDNSEEFIINDSDSIEDEKEDDNNHNDSLS